MFAGLIAHFVHLVLSFLNTNLPGPPTVPQPAIDLIIEMKALNEIFPVSDLCLILGAITSMIVGYIIFRIYRWIVEEAISIIP